MRRSRLLELLLLAAAGATIGCASFKPIAAASPVEAVASTAGEVRLTLRDGTHVRMHDPHIQGDTVVGWSSDGQHGPPNRRVPLDQVVSLDEVRPTVFGFVGWLAGGALLLLGAMALSFKLRLSLPS